MDPIDNSSKEKEAEKETQKERERQERDKQKEKLFAYDDELCENARVQQESRKLLQPQPQPMDLTSSYNASNETVVQSNGRATVVDLTRGGITIEDVFEGPENDEVIIHKYNIPMTRKDLCKLKVGVWVNDEIINFYVGLLRDRDEELFCRSRQDPSSLPSNYQKSFFATTFFFAKLLVQGIYTYANVARWTREVDVFSLKQLLFPININNSHWTQLTIHMELKEIHYYDSMSGDGRMFLKAAMQWLQDESLYKRGITLNATNEWRLIQKEAHVPQQHNGFDCGMFVIMCTRAIAYDQSLTTYNQSNMPSYRKMVGRHIIRGSLEKPDDGSFPYFFDLPPRQQQLSSPEFAFESPPQQRQNSGAFSKTCSDISSSIHTTLLLSPPKKRQRKSINTTFSPKVVVQPSQSPVYLTLLHHYNEKSIVDSSEDSGEEESNSDDYDNGEDRNVGNKDNNDSKDSEDSSVVVRNQQSTTVNLQQIPMQNRTLFSNIVRKKTKRVYRRGLSEEEKKAAHRERDKIRRDEKKEAIRGKDRDRKRAERAAIPDEKKKAIQVQDCQRKKDAASKMSVEVKAATNRKNSEKKRKSRCKKTSMRVEAPAGRQADIDGYIEIPCTYTHK